MTAPSVRAYSSLVIGLSAAALVTSLSLARKQPQVVPRRTSDVPIASILVYHRFAASALDSMTIRTSTFRSQLQLLRDGGYHVVPLRDVIEYLRGAGPAPPARAVVLTADDGHRSVFTDMWPAVTDYQVPVTLFIYPSAISNASYAMTWPQLEALQRTGLFDIQSHAYWHPNFAKEKRQRSNDAYEALVSSQLARSRAVLVERLGGRIDTIAWPFGLYDADLLRKGAANGYIAGVTLDRRPVTAGDSVMALPRLLVTDTAGLAFAAMLQE